MNTKKYIRVCQFCILIIVLMQIVALTGCNSFRINKKDDEVQHLVSENTKGYYFDLYTAKSKNQERKGIIELKKYNEDMFFRVENGAQKRQFSVQVFIDYRQVPIKIDGTEYDTFFIDAPENFGRDFTFQLVEPIDTNYNHSLLAILTAGTDVLTNEVNFKMSDNYSIAIDHVLSFGRDNAMVQPKYNIEKTETVTEYQAAGLLLNTDIKEYKRTIPDRELKLLAGEEFSLQYQVGGYENCKEVAVIVTIGSKQSDINNQDYILCEVENGALVRGTANINAPHQEGKYEIMGWVIKDPFDVDKTEYMPLDSSYRFTLNVE